MHTESGACGGEEVGLRGAVAGEGLCKCPVVALTTPLRLSQWNFTLSQPWGCTPKVKPWQGQLPPRHGCWGG